MKRLLIFVVLLGLCGCTSTGEKQVVEVQQVYPDRVRFIGVLTDPSQLRIGSGRTVPLSDVLPQRLAQAGITNYVLSEAGDGTYRLELGTSGMQWSYFFSGPRMANVKDLSPLEGLPISSLSLHQTYVEDLSPLFL